MNIERMVKPDYFGSVYQVAIDDYSRDVFPDFMRLVAAAYAKDHAEALAVKITSAPEFAALVAAEVAKTIQVTLK